jgi:transcriptional regulator with XRE-family HTH domain
MEDMGIGKRIQAAMIRANLRPVDIAKHLGIEDAAVHQWFKKDSGPRSHRIPDLARLLGVTVDELMQEPSQHNYDNEITKEVRDAEDDVSLTLSEEYKRTVSVYGTEQSGPPGGDFSMGQDTKVRVRRPPKLAGRTDILAFYVQGGGSPKYEIGDLIYCERHMPARAGDYAVVQLRSGACYLRKVVDRNPARIQLVNGVAKALEIPSAKIARVLRVMTTQDLLG